MTAVICVLCADHQTHIGHLCPRCLGQLRRDLADIVLLTPLLDDLLTPSNRAGGHASGKPGSRPPLNLDVADLRDHRGVVHAEITGWARIVIEERRLASHPAGAEQAARLLQVHLDWVAAQPWVDEAAAEIRDAAHRIRMACHDLPDPPIGRCPDIDPRGESDACGGPLRWVDGSTAVACARCHSTWVEADLPNILRVVKPNVRFPVPREWVAVRYALAPATLRQWIRRGHVKTYHDEQVELFDVLARIGDTPGVG